MHLFERRIARPLTQRERAALERRFETLGPEQVGDVVLGLSPDTIAAWLTASLES